MVTLDLVSSKKKSACNNKKEKGRNLPEVKQKLTHNTQIKWQLH